MNFGKEELIFINYIVVYNDYNGEKSDFFVEIILNNQSF